MATMTVNGLSKAQLKKLRRSLVEKAQEIGTNMRSSRAEQALGESTTNLEDLPQQSHEEWIFLNRNSIDMSLLREIHEALARMDDDSYGLCLDCEEPISGKRLEAIPWARLCITCQEETATDVEARRAVETRR